MIQKWIQIWSHFGPGESPGEKVPRRGTRGNRPETLLYVDGEGGRMLWVCNYNTIGNKTGPPPDPPAGPEVDPESDPLGAPSRTQKGTQPGPEPGTEMDPGIDTKCIQNDIKR